MAGSLLKVTFLDVGTPDAAVVSTPGGQHVLIDAGTAKGGQKVAAFLRAERIKSLACPDAAVQLADELLILAGS